MLKALASIWAKTPAIIIGVVVSALALLVSFGVKINDVQMKAIAALFLAVSPLLTGLMAHATTTPDAQIPPDVKAQIKAARKASKATQIVGGAFLMIALATWTAMAFAAILIASTGCKALQNPTVDQQVVDAGCNLIGVLDPNGQPAVALCEDLAPIAAPVIANIAKSAGASRGPPPKYVVLKHGGKQVGYARSDVAAAVQAKLDEAK